jgi:hypothetical protein
LEEIPMKLRISAVAFAFLCAASFAFAADTAVTVGTDVASPNGTDLNTNDVRTDISLDPATAGGALSSVKVYWSEANCANAFSIAVFRRSGDLLTPIGQRGPFSVTSNVMTVALNPPMKPQIVARVYNDAGTQGTAGFYADPISIDDSGPGGRVITAGASAFMATPVDPIRTRFNIGVRALFSGAELTAQLLDKNGHVLTSVTKRYPAGAFEQVGAASFFGDVPVGANETVKITVTDGSAIIYGATTDNATNDPSVQYAIVAPAAQ